MKITFIAVFGFFLCLPSLLTAQNYKPGDDFIELTDTKPHDSKEVWNKQKLAVQLQWGNIDTRYQKLSVPTAVSGNRLSTRGWKGERVNAQAVLWTNKELKNVSVTVSDLKNGSRVIPSSVVTTNFVRNIMTDELNKDKKGACGHRPNKAEWDSSMVADILDIQTKIDLQERVTQPVWVNVWLPQDAVTGKYKGTLTVTADGISPMNLQMEIEVLNHTLPQPKDWAFHLDLWQSPYAVARMYNVTLWSKEHFDIMRPLFKQLANAGQKVITATIMNKPWNQQTEDAFESMVMKKKNLDGSWEYDYTVFDTWVEFMMSVGIDKQINCFTLIPWALNFDYYDLASNQIRYVHTKPGEAAYEDYWFSFLKDFARHLKQKGWFHKTTISMDERGADVMKHAFNLIFRADPDYKVSGQGHYYPEVEPMMHEMCLAYGENFPEDVLAARRKAGKVSTVYTCCSEPFPNVFTFSPPAEAAWTMWHAMAGNYDGYLRWAFNSWTIDPLRDSRFRTWAAGDTYIVYPDRSSIRFERLVEGVQDAEKIRILREEFTTKGQKAKLDKLNKAVGKFMPVNLTITNATEMVNEGRRVLNSFK
ncbi:DUF4091 domain-containing protein [Bacteroides sp. 519]|uniref:DUF4091 domain-containing protein n=1 Tax=Bacteroides sp. 519 TaxID=2302937 RepID=UPI0013D05F56|nr:DUF4091 domain-containing protein [Bacteroides sp. 519]NDV58270.1 DUF4091 domain-containing protein [Bacteroides sp. 519]